MRCELCKGQLEDKLITYARWNVVSPVIIENVPARVCIQCKGEILTPPILDAIKEILDKKKPEKYLKIPVFNLSGADLGDERLYSPEYHPDVQCLFNASVDLRTIKRILHGKTETTIWIKGGNNIKHPDDGILKQLAEAFTTPPDASTKNIVDVTEGGYILYEIKRDIFNEKGDLIRLPVAKMTYMAAQNNWQLYWIWRSGIWQDYGIYPDLNQVVEQIKEDKLRFCA